MSARKRPLSFCLTRWAFWALILLGPLFAACGGRDGRPGPEAGSSASGPGPSPWLINNPRQKFWSVQVGRYAGRDEAWKAAESLRAHGLETFSRPRAPGPWFKAAAPEQLNEYEVSVGLLGLKASAVDLAGRLKAQGLISGGEARPKLVTAASVAPFLAPQNSRLYGRAQAVLDQAAQDAAQPTSSEVATGQAFKKVVYGQYIGSYRDRSRAEDEARSLTRAGWPASVETSRLGGGLWFRVYLAPSTDQHELRADPGRLRKAGNMRAQARGLLIIADVSGLPDSSRALRPREDRRDASPCAGYSQFGLYHTVLTRLSIHIPIGAYQVVLREVASEPTSLSSRVIQAARKMSWASAESSRRLYGPAVYDHQAFMAALGRLEPRPEPAALVSAVNWFADDLAGVAGPKTVLILSNFHLNSLEDLAGAAARLEGARVITVYGDPGAEGYRWAVQLPRGGGAAWEACRLMTDSAYYEHFVKSLLGR